MQQQVKENIYRKQNSLFSPQRQLPENLFSYIDVFIFFFVTCLFLTKRKLQ